MSVSAEDLSGREFGELVVLERVYRRIRKGWPVHEAFTAPVNTNLARV